MSKFLFFSNIQLGVELVGAIVFFIAAWLFFEAYLIKRDRFSILRALGFFLLSVSQVIRAVGDESTLLYFVGIAFVFLSYLQEKLPAKPDHAFLFALPLGAQDWPQAILLAALVFVFYRRYFKDIDRQIKWMGIGFGFLTVSSFISLFAGADAGAVFLAEYTVRLFAFLSIALWAWLFLSLRMKEEVLIVFISISLFMALVVTTTFSAFFLQRIERETERSLGTNTKVLSFYVESLKNKALAAAQIIAGNEDFVSAVKTRDSGEISKVGEELMRATGQQFLTVASKNGAVFFKANFPTVQEENVSEERIAVEALEGRPAVTVAQSGVEGFSVRAAAPIFDEGRVAGVVVTGILLNNAFADDLKKVSGFEATVFSGGKVAASSLFTLGEVIDVSQEEFVGATKLFDQEVVGAFLPVRNFEEKISGVLSLTTTPGELLRSARTTNRLTLVVVFLIVLAFLVPLYRFTVFLTS